VIQEIGVEVQGRDARSTRSMAREMGMSADAIWRIWQGFGLQPHRSEAFKLSSDPLFVEKIKGHLRALPDPAGARRGFVRG